MSASFLERIRNEECIQGSDIDAALLDGTAKPIYDDGGWKVNFELGHKVPRFWVKNPPWSFGDALGYYQESGALFCLKAENPRPTPEREEKGFGAKAKTEETVKYEFMKGASIVPFTPPIDAATWRKVARRNGLLDQLPPEVLEAGEGWYSGAHCSFWEWIKKHPEIQVVLTEGAKKALSLLSLGIVAIGLNGIWGAYSKEVGLRKEIIPFVKDRKICFAFDQDTKASTRATVQLAIELTGRLLVRVCKAVTVAVWQAEQGKGVDDFRVNCGAEAVEQCIFEAQALNSQKVRDYLKGELTYKPDVLLNCIDLTQVRFNVPDEGTTGFRGGKGTSKTITISSLIKNESKVLSMTFRIGLGRALAGSLELSYIDDLDRAKGLSGAIGSSGYENRVSLCVDSLLKIRICDIEGGVIVIDEARQVMRHLQSSSTCKSERAAITRHLAKLLKAARKIIIADADLDDATINFFKDLRGDDSIFLVHNTGVRPGFQVERIHCDDASYVMNRLRTEVLRDKKAIVHTDTNGKAIFAAIRKTAPQKRGLLINQETIVTDEVRAFLSAPAQTIKLYDYVVASPSVSTGFSITTPHFDLVFGIFSGHTIISFDMAQALSRVRLQVPRIVWCAEKGKNFSEISPSPNPKDVLEALKASREDNFALLQQLNPEGHAFAEIDWESPSVTAYCHVIACNNRSMLNLGTELDVLLENEGNILTHVWEDSDDTTKTELKEIKKELKSTENAQILAAEVIPIDEARKLENEAILPAQQLSVERAQIVDFLRIEPDALTLDDVQGYRDPMVRFAQYQAEMLLHPETAIESDTSSARAQGTDPIICPWDLKINTSQAKVREKLGLRELLENPDRQWSEASLQENGFAAKLQRFKKLIKRVLGVTVTDSSTETLGRLFKQLGIKTQTVTRTRNGERTYGIEPDSYRRVMQLAERRNKGIQAAESVTPPTYKSLIKEVNGVTPQTHTEQGLQRLESNDKNQQKTVTPEPQNAPISEPGSRVRFALDGSICRVLKVEGGRVWLKRLQGLIETVAFLVSPSQIAPIT